MTWIDWLIVIVPIIALIGMAIYSRKFVRGIVDFLAAGRVAGRYVLCVGDTMAALSIITLVAGSEQYYQTGFAVSFWGAIGVPVSIFVSLSGFVVYRWRQTRSLSFGQFIELRYGSKFFRIFCSGVRTVSEMITNSLGPAIAANFFIYYLKLPHEVMICGINLPCYAIIVGLCLALALVFILPGGRIALIITDCFQGLIAYPIFVIIVGYIVLYFSWWDDIAPVMWNRVPGQSFINPFDISELRDFNVFAVVVTIIGGLINKGAWIGNDVTNAGRTPHEQKMAGILGTFRNGMAWVMVLLLAIITITFMNSPHFAGKNDRFVKSNTELRQELSVKVLEQVVKDKEVRTATIDNVMKVPAMTMEEWAQPLSQANNPDIRYFNAVKSSLGDTPAGRVQFQEYRSLYNQMMMPMTLDYLFPVGITGLFLLLAIMLLISTDDSRLFNASSTLTQDVILPLFKKRLSTRTHLLILRLMTIIVAVFFFIVAMFFTQLDYISMFATIICAVWLGGAGPIVLFGLYSRFGNLVGAWCAIIFGCGSAFAGLILQRTWAKTVYPALESWGVTGTLDSILQTVSGPFNPWIVWTMDPHKFPINSYEIYFISMLISIIAYIAGSYLTYKPYNLDKLLHRGAYADADSPEPPKEKWTVRTVFSKLIGITPEYTLGDRVIAYSMFTYSLIYGFLIVFIGIAVWNVISPWSREWWNWKFYITALLVPSIMGIISTFWFMAGGVMDSVNLFRDLKNRNEDPNDNGQVFDE